MKPKILIPFFSLFLLSSCGVRPEIMDAPDGNVYWNPARPLQVAFGGNRTGDIQAVIKQGSSRTELEYKWKTGKNGKPVLVLDLPAGTVLPESADGYRLTVTEPGTADGNNLLTNLSVVLDTEYPRARIIEASPQIVKGGTAVVIIHAEDAHLRYPKIVDPGAGTFYFQPFRRAGYYISLMVWPVSQGDFNPVLIVEDRAGNAVTNPVPVRLKNVRYPVSYIPVDNEFHNDKLEEVGTSNTNAALSERERYDLIMQGFRNRWETNIAELTTARVYDQSDNLSYLQPFDPIPSARLTSPFGSHRLFVMKKKVVRESYHLGIDLAKVSNSDIFTATEGTVIYRGYNGANGNMILIHHGLGIFSVYAHCSKLYVNNRDQVRPGQRIAQSGKTGYALGDHLHFGVNIQGKSANPLEWMDREWLRENILDVARKASMIIDLENDQMTTVN